MRILAISGSLRAASSNSRLIEAMARAAPPDVDFQVYRGLGDLPPFNPDLEPKLPQVVANLRREIGIADAVLICSPEYAHGAPGALKNLLDWLVPSVEFPAKTVALVKANSRGEHADAQLREILTTMSADLLATRTIDLTAARGPFDELSSDPEITRLVSSVFVDLRAAVSRPQTGISDPSD